MELPQNFLTVCLFNEFNNLYKFILDYLKCHCFNIADIFTFI